MNVRANVSADFPRRARARAGAHLRRAARKSVSRLDRARTPEAVVRAAALDHAGCRTRRPARRLEPDRHARAPRATTIPNPGVYLEVVENEKLVFTDAYTTAWEPSEKPFMTAIVTFEDLGDGKTRYTARVRHWTVDDREAHEKMGFHEGWGQCADQLAELLLTDDLT